MDPNLASNSSDEASYCSIFEDDCDNEMNKWFELFFFNVDQAVFYDKKLSENYEKIDKECKVWNNLFKLKKVDLTDPELKRTIFTSEKLGKKLQLVEETCSDTGQHLMLRREKSFPQESEPKLCKISGKNASKQSKAINRYFEINDQSINEFDKITLMNQIKQDYIRRHVLNSSPKSDGNSSPHHSLSVFSPSVLFPVTTNSNLSRRKQMMLEQSKLNEEAASSCLYFFPSRKKEQAKLKKQAKEEKGKVRTVKSIMKIDQGNTSNLILNSEQFIQPPRLKTPLVLPPIHKSDLPQRFDKITLHDQSQAIVACDKSSNQCSLNLRKGQELRLSAYKRPMMLSIKNEFFK